MPSNTSLRDRRVTKTHSARFIVSIILQKSAIQLGCRFLIAIRSHLFHTNNKHRNVKQICSAQTWDQDLYIKVWKWWKFQWEPLSQNLYLRLVENKNRLLKLKDKRTEINSFNLLVTNKSISYSISPILIP